jgi:hypothetical protein
MSLTPSPLSLMKHLCCLIFVEISSVNCEQGKCFLLFTVQYREVHPVLNPTNPEPRTELFYFYSVQNLQAYSIKALIKGVVSRDSLSTETIGVWFRPKHSTAYLSYT